MGGDLKLQYYWGVVLWVYSVRECVSSCFFPAMILKDASQKSEWMVSYLDRLRRRGEARVRKGNSGKVGVKDQEVVDSLIV